MISHKKKAVFVHIPRTAGTSIEAELKKHGRVSIASSDIQSCPCQHICAGHSTALETKSDLGKNWNNYYTFTIVRNPWDRMVSVYEYIFQSDKWMKYPIFSRWIIQNKRNIKRSIARPQTDWILDENGNVLVDHIFKFEDLKTAWKQICNDLDIEHNALEMLLPSIHDHYSKYYSPKTVEIVRETYKEEIEMFNYRFESYDKSFVIH